jgi:Protein of unknown function (DUF3027)
MPGRTPKPDAVTFAAVDAARAALLADVGSGSVGDHLRAVAEDERVVTHYFDAIQPGYRGWRWAVTLVRASRSKDVTVSEIVLLPGDEAIVAPAWVPWSERVRGDDLTPGQLLPTTPDDPRLLPGYTGADEITDEAVGFVIQELGLGRPRVLSPLGRDEATDRWYDGEAGPETPMAKSAPGHCASCGFLVLLAGSLGSVFGVCTNVQAPRDGQVVSLDHGCGAHSERAAAVLGLGRTQELDEPQRALLDTLAYDI